MNTLKTSLFAILLLALVFTSCKKDEPITIDATDYVASFQYATYNPWINGSVIGNINATTNGENLNYTIVSQNIAGIIAINANTGQITVANKTAFLNDAICVGLME